MNAEIRPRLQILILAAGFSSRLGRPKALARVHGVSLLRRSLALMAQFTPAKIVVVVPRNHTRYQIEARGFKVVFATNSQRADGLSSSVRRGIAQCAYSAGLLLLPVDLAELRHRDVARLTSRWRAARRRVVARRLGQPGGAPHGGTARGGTPLVLPRWLYARALRITGDVGLRELVAGLAPEQRALVNLPSATLDVDTPEDLRAARRRLRRSSF